MAFNVKGLLGAIGGIPNAIGQGLLGPMPVNPGMGLDDQYVSQSRQQALTDLAMGLMAGNGGSTGQTMLQATQYAREGHRGRIFDMLKEQEFARLNQQRQQQDAYVQSLPEGTREMAQAAGGQFTAQAGVTAAMQPKEPSWRPMTPEEEALVPGLEPTLMYKTNAPVGRSPLTGDIEVLGGRPPAAPQITVNTNLPPSESELEKAVGKGAGEEFVGMAASARGAASTLDQLSLLEPLVNNPNFISGTMGDTRLVIAKALDLPGATDTQTYFAAVGRQVGENIKMFGAGTGLSDADREFAKQMAAGSIELTPKAIKDIMRINKTVSQNVIKNYNRRRAELGTDPSGKPRASILNIYPEIADPSIDSLLDKYAP